MGETPDFHLVEGTNCWRVTRAKRVSFLVDAAAYFEAFAAAAERAERSILVLAWDIDSRLLVPSRDGRPRGMLGDFLDGLVRRKRSLHIHLLTWDFSVIYTFEREALPEYKLGWSTHPNLRFRLDGNHPPGGSHHQKVAVVDDRVAFVGGLDLTIRRWDTPEHRPNDARRVDPGGAPYAPFHDVQVAVEGETARALGDLARERWRRATGEVLRPPPAAGDPWPPGLAPDLEDVDVAVVRTEPPMHPRPGVREGEALFVDCIAAARRSLFFEYQFLTSRRVTEALAARLSEPDGPEVVLVGPQVCSGWLEQATLGVLRARALAELRAADRFGRLRVYRPTVVDPTSADGARTSVLVHSKVLVVDDRVLRIGSGNLTNRSMGLDTECDVALDAGDDDRLQGVVAGVRDRLLGEHLGIDAARVAEARAAHGGSLVSGIETLRAAAGPRSLEPLDERVPDWLERTLPDAALVDPEVPVGADLVLSTVEPEAAAAQGGRAVRAAVVLVGALSVAAAWRWTPLSRWANPTFLLELAEPLRTEPLAPLIVVLAYVFGGLAMFPVMLLVLATGLVFGPVRGSVYALAGALASASVTYAIGRTFGERLVGTLVTDKLAALGQRLARRGFLAVAAARLVPVSHFTLFNLAAGAAKLRYRDYALGTLLGMAPGAIAFGIFGDRLRAALHEHGAASYLVLVVFAAAILAFGAWLARRLRPLRTGT